LLLAPDPDAELILVRSSREFFWRSIEANNDLLKPVADRLKAGILSSDRTSPPSLLIHVFSNGGCLQLTTLAELLSSSSSSSTPSLPARAIAFDSCPGRTTLGITLRAFTAPIKSTPVRYLAYVPLTAWFLGSRLTGQPNLIEVMRDKLNDPALLPADAQRLYLYSRIDELIDPTDVEAHANDAREKLSGAQIKLREFDGSAHVSHARTFPKEYWGEMEAMWERATTSGSN
jgi:hypothetical protein